MPATTPYPSYPTGTAPPPSSVPGNDRTGPIAAALIGAVCLGLTIAVVAFTSDKISSGAMPVGSVPGGPAGPPGGGDSVPLDELKRSFPVPPGAGASHVTKDFLQPDERAYDVRAALGAVRAYYDRRLPELGYTFVDPLPTTTKPNGGRIVGWHSPIVGDHQIDSAGYLSLDLNYLGTAPGVVTIRVSFYG